MSASIVTTPFPISNAAHASYRRWATVTSIFLSDLCALVISGTTAFLLRYAMHGQLVFSDYLPFFPLLALFLLIFTILGLYPGIAVNPIEEFQRITAGTTFGYLLIICGTFFSKQLDYSRLLFVFAWVLSIALVLLGRAATRALFSKSSWWGVPAVIVGSGPTANAMYRFLRMNPAIGLRPVAVLAESDQDVALEPPDNRVLTGRVSLAPYLAKQFKCCYAIVAMPNLSSAELSTVMSNHMVGFHHIMVIPDLFGIASLWVSAKEIGGMLCLEVRQTLAHRWPQIMKRVTDVSLATVLLAIFCPLLLVLYLCVKFTSPGPVFYSQRRLGREKNEFHAWKFRSMVMNADSVLQHHLDVNPLLKAEWEADHKLKNDPRVTTIGKFLRKTSLDELPQLWNVFVGEMSFVGPRPIVNAEVPKYGNRFDFYQKVRPGITGLWQISGRNNTTYDERTKYDEYYVRNWSLVLDLYILTRTLKTVLFAEGAY